MTDTSEADALIVRDIMIIEEAYTRADAVGRKLWAECARTIEAELHPSEWLVGAEEDPDLDNTFFAARSWLYQDVGEEKPKHWFGLNEIEGPSGSDTTWLATFLGEGPNGATAGLIFGSYELGAAVLKRLFNSNPEIVARLEQAGFVRDGGNIWLPFTLDQETVAKAIEDDDFEIAMSPLRTAIAKIVSALPDFEMLLKVASV